MRVLYATFDPTIEDVVATVNEINDVAAQLEAGQIEGRAVITPP